MNTTTQAAQVEQCQTTRLNIDFSHRLPDPFFDISSTCNLTDAVNIATDRATGILRLLSGQFMEAGDCRVNDAIMYNVITAAIREIEDVNSIVNSFNDAAILAKQNKHA